MRIDLVFSGLNHMFKSMKAESRRQRRAASVAMRAEGYRLMRLLKKQIQEGSPGGERFASMSYIRRNKKRKNMLSNTSMKANRPLSQLFRGIKYHQINDAEGYPSDIQVGFVGPLCSNSWKRIAIKHQKGFKVNLDPAFRRYLGIINARRASQLSKRSKVRKKLFLKKSTTSFEVPPRPIILPFWDSEVAKAEENILKNYKAKMAGKWLPGKRSRRR